MFDDATPIYLQVATQIEEQILSGDLAEGDQVMSTTDWARFLRINPATAARGINMLVDDGLLEKRRGIGMFVRSGAAGQLLGQRREAFFAHHVDPVATEAALLGIPIDAVIARLQAGDDNADGSTPADSSPADRDRSSEPTPIADPTSTSISTTTSTSGGKTST